MCPDLDGARFAEDDEPQSYPTRTAVVVFRVDANLPLVPVDVPCGSDVIFLAHALGCRVAVDLEQLHRACGFGDLCDGSGRFHGEGCCRIAEEQRVWAMVGSRGLRSYASSSITWSPTIYLYRAQGQPAATPVENGEASIPTNQRRSSLLNKLVID